jgi:putative glutamine amidotransferase
MDKKRIFGVSANTSLKNAYDVKCTGVSCDYIEAIRLAGGVPIMLPPLADVADISRQLDSIDVLVISGGEDIHPSNYGEEPSLLLGEVSPDRDLFELQLVRLAFDRGIPILGICRGLQVINVAFGGTIHQDISHLRTTIDHDQQQPRHEATHVVEVDENSLFYRIVNKKQLHINSFHHQAVKQLAEGIRANAHTECGLIEGIEMHGKAPVLGVQWHPEMMASTDPTMLNLFKYFSEIKLGGIEP